MPYKISQSSLQAAIEVTQARYAWCVENSDESQAQECLVTLAEYQRMTDIAEGKLKGKGVKGGSCNVTACQKPDSAYYFNKSTHAYYCKECADEINWPGGRADCMELYGTPLLCELDEEGE